MNKVNLKSAKDRRDSRSCFDRLWYRINVVRRRRRVDPAFGVLHQLLSIFGFIALTAPLAISSSPDSRAHGRAERDEVARRLDIPKRYVHVHLRLGRVPTSLLFEDLRRPAARLDAIGELRKRLPEPTLVWLDHIVREDAWSDLTRCHVQSSDDLTSRNVLRSTIRWLEAQVAEEPQPPGGAVNGGDGGAPPPAAQPDEPRPDGDGPRFS